MHSFLAPLAFFGGLAVLVLGERMFGPGHALRLPVTGLAALALLGALGLRTRDWMGAAGDARKVLFRLAASYDVALLGLALYAWTAVTEDTSTDAMVAVRVAWPIVLLCGVSSVLFMEMSMRSMVGAQFTREQAPGELPWTRIKGCPLPALM